MQYEFRCIVTPGTEDELPTIIISDDKHCYQSTTQATQLNAASCKTAFAQFGLGYWDAVLKDDIRQEEEN